MLKLFRGKSIYYHIIRIFEPETSPMRYQHLLLVAIFLFGSQCTFAQSTETEERDNTPKYVNDFLSIGVGARAMAMGNVGVASVNDITAGYWNPAGLLEIKADLQLAGLHANRFANINKYDYGAIGKAIDSTSAIGFSVIRSGVDDIPNTLELVDADGNFNYDRISLFSAVDYAFVASYARHINKVPGLRMGVNAKVIYRSVGDFASAWGFGLDAGLMYDVKNWKFGLMARDVTTTFNAWDFTLSPEEQAVLIATGNEIPENSLEITLPRFILGAARQWDIKKQMSLLAEVNFDITTDGQRNTLISANPISVDPRLGLELGYKNTIFLRGGSSFQRFGGLDGEESIVPQPSFGVGLRIRQLFLDYALTIAGDDSSSNGGALNSNVFSLKLNIFKQGK